MSQRDVQVFQIGERLGDYEVVGLLGFGGMGVVYRVRNVISEREEAMKVLLPDVRNAPELAGRFMREIKIQARLTHPGIAALYTALSVDHRLIMMLELVEGSSLAERLHQGPLASGEVRDIGCQVLAALGYAHSMGVVHRDIKPANIMISPSGVAKLMDFGIAKAAREQSLTQAGTALGSYAYMSPEQVLGHVTDARSDLYSLGITLYEALAGRHPLSGANEHASVATHLQKAPVPLVDLVPGVAPRFSEIVSKALEKEPRDRFQTAAEFRAALESASPGAGLAPTPPMTPGHLDPAVLAKVERCLSAALGPIARQMLIKASGRHFSKEALCQNLACEIAAQADRDAFLRCSRARMVLFWFSFIEGFCFDVGSLYAAARPTNGRPVSVARRRCLGGEPWFALEWELSRTGHLPSSAAGLRAAVSASAPSAGLLPRCIWRRHLSRSWAALGLRIQVDPWLEDLFLDHGLRGSCATSPARCYPRQRILLH